MYVYVFESLATTFREYKTLRMCEFYGMSQIIINPQPPVSNALKEEEKAAAEMVEGLDKKVMREKMAHFYKTYKQ